MSEPCCFCGSPATESDHIEAKAKGGRDDWSNRSPVCRDCNAAKGTKDLLTFMRIRTNGGDGMKTLEELKNVAEIRETLEVELAQARADATKLAKQAQDEGETIVSIAKAAGVSRVTLYEMLKR